METPVFLFLGVYDDEAQARTDLELVRALHAKHEIGSYDAGLVTKEADGGVKVHKWEKPTQHGAWTGAAVGAVVAVLIPPLAATVAVGAVAGGLIGHFWRGMSRKDVHELGEALDEGQALLVVIGQDKLDVTLEKAGIKAKRHVQKELGLDGVELQRHLDEAAKELQSA